MPLTRFPYGVSSYGAPIMPGPGVIPTVNTAQGPGVYFVNGDFGNDGYSGASPQQCIKSLDVAYNKCAGGNNEIVYLIGGTAAVSYSSAIASGGAGLVWAKNYTHLIGLTAPSRLGQRARITGGVSTVLLTPLLTVSGNSCLFQNVEIANVGSHATTSAVSVAVTGTRNTFINCQITSGIGALNVGAAMRALIIGGTTGGTGTTTADENFFQHCYIGDDTISKTSTSSEIEILGGSARVIFEDCIISTFGTGGNLYLTIGANGIDRFVMFDHCKFLNAYTFRGGTILTDAFAINAAPGGLVVICGGSIVTGATALSASDTAIFSGDPIPSVSGAKAIAMTW